MLNCAENVEKSDTLVHSSTTQERNLESSRIQEVGMKCIFPEIGKEPGPSIRVNLEKIRPQREPKVHNTWAPDRRDRGYTEPQFHHRYQSKEL